MKLTIDKDWITQIIIEVLLIMMKTRIRKGQICCVINLTVGTTKTSR